MKDHKYSWFKIMHASGFGARSMYYIYSQLKVNGHSISDFFHFPEKDIQELFPDLGKGLLSRAKFENLIKLDDSILSKSYDDLRESGTDIITVDDKIYPKIVLKKLGSDAPLVLFCKGHLSLLNSKSVAIVGSRNANEQTINFTKDIAIEFVKRGYNIVSGNAKGTDRAAHSAALESNGTTTMVLPEGFDNSVYDNGDNQTLVISQFLPQTTFRGSFAMTRNKLLVALSEATVVITSGPERDERGKMSGTFDAARSTLHMNIPLYVVSPMMFEISPTGNREIISLGAKEIFKEKSLVSKRKIKSSQLLTTWIQA